jgi:hypothetical protein
MTRDRDIERVLDRFYAEGPLEMPDRVLLGVFDRIERVPQRRLASRLMRFAAMNSNLRLAAAAAIVVAVVGVGAFAFSRLSNVAAPPTPGPSLGVSPTPGVGGSSVLPDALQGRWVGPPRVVPEAPEPPARFGLILTDVQMGFALDGQGTQLQFASTASLVGSDQLRFVGASTDGGCRARDEGTYSFRVSNVGTTLTLTPIADACGPRAAALAGDWNRALCPDTNSWCLGDLQPGMHASTVFTPFVAPSAWTYAYGKFTYTTPARWANTEDCTGCYVLTQQLAPKDTGIEIWSEVAAHRQDDTCKGGPAPGVGRSADAIVTFLTKLPGLTTSTPVPVTIGGLSGKMVDLAVKPTWTTSCSYSNPAGRPLVSTFSDPVAEDGLDWNIGAGGRTRVIALDLGDGRALIINIEAQNQADYDALLPDAMQVVNTFDFKH